MKKRLVLKHEIKEELLSGTFYIMAMIIGTWLITR